MWKKMGKIMSFGNELGNELGNEFGKKIWGTNSGNKFGE